LPVANQKLKVFQSFLSGKMIQGSAIPVDVNEEQYVSLNEALHWQFVNPYSPLLNGEFFFF
jgi:hypothetical protein